MKNTFISTILTFALASAVHGKTHDGYLNTLWYDLYTDDNCTDFIRSYPVYHHTCATPPQPGWSSMKIVTSALGFEPYSGTVIAFTHNECGADIGGSHGYDVKNDGCLNGFGFSANAFGWDCCN